MSGKNELENFVDTFVQLLDAYFKLLNKTAYLLEKEVCSSLPEAIVYINNDVSKNEK